MRALRTVTKREQTVSKYHDFYIICDVLQLVDVLQRFKQIAYAQYGLDPVYYYSALKFRLYSLLHYTHKVITHVSSDKTVDEEHAKD